MLWYTIAIRSGSANATREAGEPLHAGKTGGKSVWLAWRPPVSGLAQLSTRGSAFDTLLAVYTNSSVSQSNFVAADGVSASYGRAAGETVASSPYHITATLSPASVLGNYTITNAGADFSINRRLATWATTAASKSYGDGDPSP